MARLRCIRKTLVFVSLTLMLSPLYFVVLIAGYPWRKQTGPRIVQEYSRMCLRICGVEVLREGSIPAMRDRMLIMSNHASFLDIFVLSALFGSVFVSKDDVKFYPIVGQIAWLMGVFFFDRGSARQRMRLIRTIASDHSWRRIAVFPQGTTGTASMKLPFQRGIFKAVELDPGIAIQPVTLAYENEAELSWRAPESLLNHAKKVCSRRQLRVVVTVHRLLTKRDIEGKGAVELSEAVERIVTAPLVR